MISTLCWVPKGAAKATPDKYELTAEEVEGLRRMAEAAGEMDAEEDKEADGEGDAHEADDAAAAMDADDMTEEQRRMLQRLRMDDYDEDEEEEEGVPMHAAGMAGLPYHAGDDPYVTIPEDAADSEEEEDFTVRATDAIVLVARTDVEEGHSVLEVHLYEEDTGNFYVHHDYPLSAYPLCLAWMSMHPAGAAASAAAGPAAVADAAAAAAPEGPGNYAAVGTFAQGIEIWNLDLLDAPEPTCTLGGVLDEKVDTKARKRVTRLAPDSHKKEVMALSWNAAHRYVLASGSADKAVKLWDVTLGKCLHTLSSLHTDKVQSVQWNPAEPACLATGSFDGTAKVTDVRTGVAGRTFKLGAQIESLVWNPHNPALLTAATSQGKVLCYDVRMESKLLFSLQASSDEVSSVSYSTLVPGLLATSSVDKTVKLWDVQDGRPAFIAEKNMGSVVGQVFCGAFFPDSPFLYVAGGSEGGLAFWNTNAEPSVSRRFKSRVLAQPAAHQGTEGDAKLSLAGAPAAAGAVPGDEAAATAAAVAAAAAATPDGEAARSRKRRQKNKKRGADGSA